MAYGRCNELVDMYSGGNISLAAMPQRRQGLLLDGIYLKRPSYARASRRWKLKAQLKVGFPLLAYKFNQSKFFTKHSLRQTLRS